MDVQAVLNLEILLTTKEGTMRVKVPVDLSRIPPDFDGLIKMANNANIDSVLLWLSGGLTGADYEREVLKREKEISEGR